MLETLTGFLHHATTLLFGIYVSAAFLGLKMKKRNVLTLFLFALGTGILFSGSYLAFGFEVTQKLYPLIIHLPLALFLILYFKFKPAQTVLSVLTAYLLCQISNWFGKFVLVFTNKMWIYFTVRTIVTTIIFVVIIYYISAEVSKLLHKPTRAIIMLGIIPAVYYVFDYTTEVYTDLLYSGKEVFVEFMGFIMCIAYLVFLFLYLKEYEEKKNVEQLNQLIEMKMNSSEKEIETIRNQEYELSIMRHDMRHYLNNISVLLKGGEFEKAESYIKEVNENFDKTVIKKYCLNEFVNSVVSVYADKCSENGITFEVEIDFPKETEFSCVSFSTILSNGLENAYNSALKTEGENRKISLFINKNGNKTLLKITNGYSEKPKFIDGMPVSNKSGHGVGTQSIYHTTETLGGNCRFEAENGLFVLMVVI